MKRYHKGNRVVIIEEQEAFIIRQQEIPKNYIRLTNGVVRTREQIRRLKRMKKADPNG